MKILRKSCEDEIILNFLLGELSSLRFSEKLLKAFFGLFIFIDTFNSLNARTNKINILSNINKNKIFLFIIIFIAVVQLILIYFGGTMFRTSGLAFHELQMTILLATTVIPADWIRKILLNRKNKNTGV